MKIVHAPDDDESPDDDDGYVDEAGVLALRLEQLRDEGWMRPVLDRLLARMSPNPPVVTGYEIEYCKIKPNRDINLVAHVQLTRNGATLPSRRLACTILPSAEACRAKYVEDEQNRLSEATLRRLRDEGFSQPFTSLDEPAMIARAFPVDPLLPGLAHATEEEDMSTLFARVLEPCLEEGRMPRGFSCEILHYKPRRSCTLHYQLDLGQRDEQGKPKLHRIYGKLSRDDRGVRNDAILRAAWNAAQASGGAWHAARPLGYLPEWRLLLQEAVQGRDFRVVFAELTPDDGDPRKLALARDHLLRIVQALRSLQRAPVGPGPVKTFEHLLAEQERNLHYLHGAEPALGGQLAAIRSDLARLESTTRPAPLVFCHGDFAHGNVLIDGERVGIIDFDKAGAAEPAYDMAYFLTHLWSFGLRHPKRMPHVVRLWRDMRDAFLDLAPEVTSPRLALYEALDFAAYVLRNFRKQSHQAKWMEWAKGQVEAAKDRLEVAAGGSSAHAVREPR